MERTLILFKPDCVQRRLVGRVLSRFEDKGFNVIAMKMMRVTSDLARQHYEEHVDKPFYPGLEKFITGAPVVAAIIEGLEAIRGELGLADGHIVNLRDGRLASFDDRRLTYLSSSLVCGAQTASPRQSRPCPIGSPPDRPAGNDAAARPAE